MEAKEFDWDYYEKYEEDIRNGKHFDNNYMCWTILKKSHLDSPLTREIEDFRKLLCGNHKYAPKTFIDILLYIEYLEWRLYLLDVRRFMRIGRTYEVFSKDTLVKELNIDKFQRRFDTLMFSTDCYPDKMIDNKDNAGVALTYDSDFEQFSILDVSIATGIEGYIKHAINIGCDRYIENSYIIPELVPKPTGEEYCRCFIPSLIIHENIYKKYRNANNKSIETSNVTKHITQSSKSEGIYNIFTGEIVRPKDGTYYIDDFR